MTSRLKIVKSPATTATPPTKNPIQNGAAGFNHHNVASEARAMNAPVNTILRNRVKGKLKSKRLNVSNS